jgi:hypothetical protein
MNNTHLHYYIAMFCVKIHLRKQGVCAVTIDDSREIAYIRNSFLMTPKSSVGRILGHEVRSHLLFLIINPHMLAAQMRASHDYGVTLLRARVIKEEILAAVRFDKKCAGWTRRSNNLRRRYGVIRNLVRLHYV